MEDINLDFYARYNSWDATMCKKVKYEYERFLELRAGNSSLSPSDQIDKFWHTHILDTNSYLNYCLSKWNKIVHHNPAEAIDQQARQIRLANTIEQYKQKYGSFKYPEVWANSANLSNSTNSNLHLKNQNNNKNCSAGPDCKICSRFKSKNNILDPNDKLDVRNELLRKAKKLQSEAGWLGGWLGDSQKTGSCGNRTFKNRKDKIKHCDKNLPNYLEFTKVIISPNELGFYINYELSTHSNPMKMDGEIIKIKISNSTTFDDIKKLIKSKLEVPNGYDIQIETHPDYVIKPSKTPTKKTDLFDINNDVNSTYFEYKDYSIKPDYILSSDTSDCKLYVVFIIEMTSMGYC